MIFYRNVLRRSAWSPPLAVGAVALVAALGLLVGLEMTGGLMTGADSAVLNWMLGHRSSMVTSAAVAVTHSGTSPLLLPLVALAGLVVGLRTGRWTPGVAALGVVVFGVLSRFELSQLVGDARPPQVDWLAPAHGFSFPSGHASTSALVAGTLAWLLTYLVHSRPGRLVIAACLGGWALLVALSRMYLGVHWVSDILGSWLLASAWLVALLAVGGRRRRQPSALSPEVS